VEAVAEGRDISVDEVLSDFGGGAEFVAAEALERGMIDSVSTTADLLDRLVTKSASLRVPNRELGMKKNLDTPTVDAQTDVEFEHQRQEAIRSAIAAERKRMQSIEAVGLNFVDADSRVREAVSKVITDAKYDDAQTPDTVLVGAYRAAYEVQGRILAEVGTTRAKLGAQLAGIPVESNTGSDQDSNLDRVKNLRTGFAGK